MSNIKKIDDGVATIVAVDVERLAFDGGTQARVAVCPQTVSEYAAVFEVVEDGGWPFPPLDVFESGVEGDDRLWVADGFHRGMAAISAGWLMASVVVHRGGVKGALKFALGANVDHGLRRSPSDLKRAVELACAEFPELSDRAVAEVVRCHHATVAKYRPVEEVDVSERVGRDGKVYPTADGATMSKAEISERCGVRDEFSDDDEDEGESGGLACMAYDVAFVQLDERPGLAEVAAWVDPVPSWQELLVGSDIPVRRMDNECGVPSNMVRRELVIEWCKQPVSPGDDAPRWDGFRVRPVSLEHAERERRLWRARERVGREVAWLKDVIEKDDVEEVNFEAVCARQALLHVCVEGVRLAASVRGFDEVDDFTDMLRRGEGDVRDVLALLLGTELHERGHELLDSWVLSELSFS